MNNSNNSILNHGRICPTFDDLVQALTIEVNSTVMNVHADRPNQRFGLGAAVQWCNGQYVFSVITDIDSPEEFRAITLADDYNFSDGCFGEQYLFFDDREYTDEEEIDERLAFIYGDAN